MLKMIGELMCYKGNRHLPDRKEQMEANTHSFMHLNLSGPELHPLQ